MDSKFEYELGSQLERPSFNKISTKVMAIWREAEEGTELYIMCEDLMRTIEQEQVKLESLKSVIYLIASKM